MDNNYLAHHGILGMKWGVRRYQNEDGSYTNAGAKRHAEQQESLQKQVASRSKFAKEFRNDAREYASKGRFIKSHIANKAARQFERRAKKSQKQLDKVNRKIDKLNRTPEEIAQDRKQKIKRGAMIVAGVALAAGAGYALYKTGAAKNAIDFGKSAIDNLMSNGKMADKASNFANKASQATEEAKPISVPLGGKKPASAPRPATNITESGQGMSIPLGGKKSASAPRPATNITESGQGMRVPIKPSVTTTQKAATTPVTTATKSPTASTGRKVAVRVLADTSDVPASSGDSFTFSPRAQRNMERARKAANSLDASTDSMLSFSSEAMRKMGL